MKCNLPKGFRANIQEESFDQREPQAAAKATFIDRKNISLGAGESHRLPQGTGRSYDFSSAARARREAQEKRHAAVMRRAQMSEAERNLQRRISRIQQDTSESNSEM